ncbi:MAG: hypothetical protein AAB414_05070 [Patescibacteria group bacterium]
MRILRLLAVILLLVGAYYLLTNFRPASPAGGPQAKLGTSTTSTSWQDAPEMKDILDPSDQEKRLKAGRKLVERVGVEDALEILEHSPLPHTGEGHLVVHQIGFYAYQTFGVDSILKCKDYFLYACYHGTIIEAASDQGFDAISKMTDKCKASPVRHFQCVHAAGHSILAIWNYDLPKALETCDSIYEKDTAFPEALSSCHNGAFMENLFGVHDWGSGKEAVRDWLKDDDPYFPCNYFEEKYQRGCWLNQAARIYQMNSNDIVKTTELCEGVGNEQYVAWCMDNVARQIHPLTNGDPIKTFELCQQVGQRWYDNCIVVNAGSFYSVGGKEQAIFICQNVPPHLKGECYQRIIGQIVSDPIERSEKEKLCQKLEGPYQSQCFDPLTT